MTKNVVANVVGKGWSAAVSMGALPLYARLLGIEAYGVIGFFASLQAVLLVLDLGLAPTLVRSLAQLSASRDERSAQTMRDLVWTFGLLFTAAGAVLGAGVCVLAPAIAVHWLRAEHLAVATLTRSVALMGLVLAAQWPGSLFVGGLMALQRQVAANVVQASLTTLRAAGALAVLAFVSPTLEAFFLWQAGVAVAQTVVTYLVLIGGMPPSAERARARLALIGERWRFAAGMAGIALMSIVLTQADKVVLSRQLTLSDYGYYSLAAVAAGATTVVAGPIISAAYPVFCQLSLPGSEGALADIYHRTCQMISVVVLPVGIVLVTCPRVVLFVWTGDPAMGDRAALPLALLAVGSMFNALMTAPYQLQIAHGWTRLTLFQNIALVMLVVPALLLATSRWGAAGAAGVWAVLNASYVAVAVTIMHTRILRGHQARWYLVDLALPLLGALAITAPARLSGAPAYRPLAALWLAVVLSASGMASVALAPALRGKLVTLVRRRLRPPARSPQP